VLAADIENAWDSSSSVSRNTTRERSRRVDHADVQNAAGHGRSGQASSQRVGFLSFGSSQSARTALMASLRSVPPSPCSWHLLAVHSHGLVKVMFDTGW